MRFLLGLLPTELPSKNRTNTGQPRNQGDLLWRNCGKYRTFRRSGQALNIPLATASQNSFDRYWVLNLGANHRPIGALGGNRIGHSLHTRTDS